MKALHTNPEAKETIINSVTSWYKWCMENAPASVNHVTKILDSKIGHISKKQMSVQIVIEDENGNESNVYITPVSWFVKGHLSGKTYNFTKKAMLSIG